MGEEKKMAAASGSPHRDVGQQDASPHDEGHHAASGPCDDDAQNPTPLRQKSIELLIAGQQKILAELLKLGGQQVATLNEIKEQNARFEVGRERNHKELIGYIRSADEGAESLTREEEMVPSESDSLLGRWEREEQESRRHEQAREEIRARQQADREAGIVRRRRSGANARSPEVHTVGGFASDWTKRKGYSG